MISKYNSKNLLIISFLYAFLIISARGYILFFYSADTPDHNHVISIVLSMANELLIGFLIIFLLLKITNACLFHIYFFGLFLFIGFNLACFHYEAVFKHLPGIDVLFYLNEIEHLKSSLQSHLPLLGLFIETAVITLIIYLSVYFMDKSVGHNLNKHEWQWKVIFLSGLLFSALTQIFPSIIPEKYFWGTRQAVIWMLQSHSIKESYDIDKLRLDTDDFQKFLYLHGLARSVPKINPEYPICGYAHGKNKVPNNRNVALLVLEGVGQLEMNMEYDGEKLMPNLYKIASENFKFDTFFASGTKSIQALPAIFSGLPAQPYLNYLWRSPSLNFNGFPQLLKDEGYETVFLHGSDLSFERQRLYIESVGFNEIIEYNPDYPYRVYGWGYDDGVMFDLLKKRIEAHKLKKPQVPFLASLFTLSTHDPYVLPEEWTSKISKNIPLLSQEETGSNDVKDKKDSYSAFLETYAFLDHHLGLFYEWFKENTDNTILIITGDHAPHLINDGDGTNDRNIRFNVPFIIAGLSEKELNIYENYSSRVGAMHDIPSTIMHLLGRKPHNCDLGLNLLSADNEWPRNRVIYSVGGDSMERVFMRTRENEDVIYDRARETFKWLDSTKTGSFSKNIEKTFNTIALVHYYLINKNAYFTKNEDYFIDAIPTTHIPIVVSHRGNTSGPGTSLTENRRNSIDAAIKSGFEWVEVDIQMTSDGHPVLMHDPVITINNNQSSVIDITLKELISTPGYTDILTLENVLSEYSEKINFLIEIKPILSVAMQFHAVREISRMISENQKIKDIIVDSFQESIIRSIKLQCKKCKVGFDTPFQEELKEEDFEHMRKMDMDWVYVHYSLVNERLIEKAHKYGLKIMAYTVNSKDIIDGWTTNSMPDGIITDIDTIKNNINALFQELN